MIRAAAALAGTCLLLAGLSGCGVPTEDSARVMEQTAPAARRSPTPAVTATGTVVERLFLVRDGLLVAVERKVPTRPDAQQLVADLIAGPTPAEQDAGIISALQGVTAISSATDAGGSATVELSTALEGIGRADDVLPFAQLVCTLSSRQEISRVVFTRQGARIGVPREDGSLTEDPLTCADYAGLVRP